MKIEVLNDFRNLKAGYEYDFTTQLQTNHRITVVGENGCGKSSLFQALRGSLPKQTRSMYETEYVKLSKHIKITHSYEKILFLDGVKDNGLDYNNSYDASEYLTNGAYEKQHLSHGVVNFM